MNANNIERKKSGMLCLCLIAAFGATACSETYESRYSSGSLAISDGAVKRGWMPSFVPNGAADVIEVHDIDTNRVIGAFTLDKSVTPSVLDQFKPTAFGDTLLNLDGRLLENSSALTQTYKEVIQGEPISYIFIDATTKDKWFVNVIEGDVSTFLFWR